MGRHLPELANPEGTILRLTIPGQLRQNLCGLEKRLLLVLIRQNPPLPLHSCLSGIEIKSPAHFPLYLYSAAAAVLHFPPFCSLLEYFHIFLLQVFAFPQPLFPSQSLPSVHLPPVLPPARSEPVLPPAFLPLPGSPDSVPSTFYVSVRWHPPMF